MSQFLVAPMRDRKWSRIVNVSGAIVAKGMNAAVPAKSALESSSKAGAALHVPHGVPVNCVAPGRINTPQILERLHPTEESRAQYISGHIPAGRFGEPEEVAMLITFLSSCHAAYISGVTLPVDGGALRFAF